MPSSFTTATRDSLSNLAASLGAGKDKAAHDAFTVVELGRGQIEAMYRGDWLAREVVDIVPCDCVRDWRSWSGHRADVARIEAAERRYGLRKLVQRAMVLGRLYGGGGGVIVGTGEPLGYTLSGAGRAPVVLHPSRVVSFLGNPLPDPILSASPWSDPVLQAR